MVVDSHCHASDRWYEPIETLIEQMDRNGVARAVLVQMLGTFDPSYMLAAKQSHPGRFAVVGGVSGESEDACSTVRDGAAVLDGLRLRPTSRSPGRDPLIVWRCAADAALPISCVGKAADFVDPAFRALAAALPRLPIVLEHFGGLARPDVGDRAVMADHLLDLADLPNLHLKLTGLGQLAPRSNDFDGAGEIPLELGDTPALINRVIAAFGPDRIMWGSDFPPVASREGYANALAWPRAMLAHHGKAAVDAIFGGTASQVFFRDA